MVECRSSSLFVAATMSTTLVCIQLSRTLILLLSSTFILLSVCRMLHIAIIPWPTYHSTVFILLDLVLLLGLIASLFQHLKTLIFFGWLIALTFLLIFFGNTVSRQYQSDLLGKFCGWMFFSIFHPTFG